MAKASKVLEIAAGEIGYKESPANSNNNKYGVWYGMNYEPWCDIFVSWVGNQVRGFIPGFSHGPAPVSKEHDIWGKALRGEGDLFVTADQAFVVTKILDSIYYSSKHNKPVYFDEEGMPIFD